MYPQDYGGPTISNNLIPCCKNCNSEKANLTVSQYEKYILAKNQEKGKEYLEDIKIYKDYIRKCVHYEIPMQWVEKKEVDQIIVKLNLENEYSKAYWRVDAFYKKYGYFKKILLVDRKGCLLYGFVVLAYAKNNGIKYVPTIKLDNVEVVT